MINQEVFGTVLAIILALSVTLVLSAAVLRLLGLLAEEVKDYIVAKIKHLEAKHPYDDIRVSRHQINRTTTIELLKGDKVVHKKIISDRDAMLRGNR